MIILTEKDTKKIQPTFPKEVIELIRTELRPKFGGSDSEIIRHIVYSWLSEHSYFDKNDRVRK